MSEIVKPVPGPDNGYIEPSPEVSTVKDGQFYINAAYASFPANPPRLPGMYHKSGTCGYMGSLCHTCHDNEVKWHLPIAERIGRTDPPREGERYVDYWRRIRGRMLDSWPEAAFHAMKQGSA